MLLFSGESDEDFLTELLANDWSYQKETLLTALEAKLKIFLWMIVVALLTLFTIFLEQYQMFPMCT